MTVPNCSRPQHRLTFILPQNSLNNRVKFQRTLQPFDTVVTFGGFIDHGQHHHDQLRNQGGDNDKEQVNIPLSQPGASPFYKSNAFANRQQGVGTKIHTEKGRKAAK